MTGPDLICAICGSRVMPENKFCGSCGNPRIDGVASDGGASMQSREPSKWCDQCEKELDKHALFCSQCGSRAEEVDLWVCLECGGDIELDDKFCAHCGVEC
jgi:predicted amidophosphoribosyltransferase